MYPNLKGIEVAVLGGDAREFILVSELLNLGAKIKITGLPVQKLPNVTMCKTVIDALEGVDAVILPVPGINEDSTIYSVFSQYPLKLSEEVLVTLPKGTPVFTGFARRRLVDMIRRCNLKLIEVLCKCYSSSSSASPAS